MLLSFDNVSWYVGFSGVLHSVYIHCGYTLVQQGKCWGWLLVAGAVLKGLQEFVAPEYALAQFTLKFHIVTEVHVYGAIWGVLFVAICHYWIKASNQPG